ncbi:MAG: diphthine--ammonia ligase [Candidatus Omnitrophica bacterium]|nr:diphthine--ammonia ligase [Candidatus Omnitrophota bacterium]
MPEPVLMCWSGGKDSSLALQAALRDPALRIEALVTTVTDGYERISMHGVRCALLVEQAEAIGLPLEQVRIPIQASNASYEEAMGRLLQRYQARGVSRVIFGDLFLQDIRRYRERQLAQLDMAGLFPLWGQETRRLAEAFIASGFRAILVCVDPKQLDPSFCGREFDDRLLADLPPSADPCGENGEFHTFVYEGPIFRRPIEIVKGEVVHRDGFWFCDLQQGRAREWAKC